jgi:hypothetical protein
MKRFLGIFFGLFLFFNVASAQVLQSSGVNHTLWTGFGAPLDNIKNDNRSKFRFYGFIETYCQVDSNCQKNTCQDEKIITYTDCKTN